MVFKERSMIGSNSAKELIEAQLQTICNCNASDYKHILILTDAPIPEITLGWGKYNKEDDQKLYRLRINLLSGVIKNPEGNEISLMYYDYFKLSKTFEEDMNEALDKLNDALSEVTKEEVKTIEILERIIQNIGD